MQSSGSDGSSRHGWGSAGWSGAVWFGMPASPKFIATITFDVVSEPSNAVGR
jgi:hypothetical protein